MWGKNGPCSKTTQLSLSTILLGARTHQGGASQSWEGGASGCPMRRRYWLGLWEGGRSGPCLRTTPFSLSQILPRPQKARNTWSPVELENLPWGKGPSQVLGKVGRMASTPKPHHPVTDTPWGFPDLFTLAQEADSSVGCDLHRMGQQGVQNVRLYHSPRLCFSGESSAAEISL